MNNERQEEYNKLIATLGSLNIQDLLLLFIEAKTGTQDDIDKLPVSLLQAIDEIGEELNKIYADKVIGNLFK